MAHFPEHLADRFKRFKLRHFALNQEHYEELAEYGQQPDTMIVSCCDSRVAPETIFSALPGELFVVRNVANLVPPYETSGRYHGVSAALEFATLNLRVKHIVIMAHSSCGGVSACLNHDVAKQTDDHFISNWMSILEGHRDDVVARLPNADESERQAALERETVKASLKNLRTFPFVEELENKGRLFMHGAHFNIESGTLSVLNTSTDQFIPL